MRDEAGAVPSPLMCGVFGSWAPLLDSATAVAAANGGRLPETFTYDLVNLGREVLAQLSTPASHHFSLALGASPLSAASLNSTAAAYLDVLADLDTLLATDSAFQLGPWIGLARRLAGEAGSTDDCTPKGEGVPPELAGCEAFYEWNARVQLTSWIPVANRTAVIDPNGPNDYAAKHWNGLVKDFYHQRSLRVHAAALAYAEAGKPLDAHAIDLLKGRHAYEWQTASKRYPAEPVGDAVEVSKAMLQKHAGRFASCQ